MDKVLALATYPNGFWQLVHASIDPAWSLGWTHEDVWALVRLELPDSDDYGFVDVSHFAGRDGFAIITSFMRNIGANRPELIELAMVREMFGSFGKFAGDRVATQGFLGFVGMLVSRMDISAIMEAAVIKCKAPIMRCAHCNTEASKVCTACGVTAYCTRECSVAHWPTHKTTCEKVDVGLYQWPGGQYGLETLAK